MSTKRKSPPEHVPLSEFLCFAVYSANLAFGKAYRPVLEELGLTYTQYVTVIALAEEDNVTVSTLGEKLFLESNTLTPILKKLEAAGYVERQRDAQDERLVRVRLTAAGHQLRETALSRNSGLRAATGLSPEEFTRMQKGVVALRNSLIEATEAQQQE